MEGQMNLTGTGVDAFHIQCLHHFAEGWSVRVGARLNGQTWSQADVREYSFLSTSELLDVLAAELDRTLG